MGVKYSLLHLRSVNTCKNFTRGLGQEIIINALGKKIKRLFLLILYSYYIKKIFEEKYIFWALKQLNFVNSGIFGRVIEDTSEVFGVARRIKKKYIILITIFLTYVTPRGSLKMSTHLAHLRIILENNPIVYYKLFLQELILGILRC